MVPWPPGGATDQVARILGPELSKAMGVPVIIENKGGAGGGSVESFTGFAMSEIDRYREIVRMSGAPKE